MTTQEKIYKYFEQYSDLHVLFVFDPNGLHLVPAHHILVISTEALTVHIVQLFAAYARIQPAYVLYKLNHHLFPKPLLA